MCVCQMCSQIWLQLPAMLPVTVDRSLLLHHYWYIVCWAVGSAACAARSLMAHDNSSSYACVVPNAWKIYTRLI